MRRGILGLAALLAMAAAGCEAGDGSPARATVRNDFSTARFTLVDVVYRGTGWTDPPLSPGAQSVVKDVDPGLEYAFALAVWDYDGAASPAQVPLVIRTKAKVESVAGAAVDVVFSEPTHYGKCAGMAQAEYDDIAAQQFPGRTVQPYGQVACAP
jgi:hypothetical protein